MNEVCRNVAAEKIKEMPVERVMKLLIFMAGMEAEQAAEAKQADGPGECYPARIGPYQPGKGGT